MAKNVFISFRFSDGNEYKEELSKIFEDEEYVVDYSEDEDRSEMCEETIKKYLYSKLKEISVIIVILTPEAINYKKDCDGNYDDWLYDELRYSLEDRDDNKTKGAIAVYTSESTDKLISKNTHECSICKKKTNVKTIHEFENLVRKNMMNVKKEYKKNKCNGVYDSLEDSYISLISYDDFKKDIKKYIENASEKKEKLSHYNIVKKM